MKIGSDTNAYSGTYDKTLSVDGASPAVMIFDDTTHFMVMRTALDNKSEIM